MNSLLMKVKQPATEPRMTHRDTQPWPSPAFTIPHSPASTLETEVIPLTALKAASQGR